MSSICSIYKITNMINQKSYIGQTWQKVDRRFQQHCSKRSKCIKLIRSINKYGKDNFIVETIGLCYNQEDSDNMECHFINQFNTIEKGYNLTYGGSNGKPTPETLIKLRNSHLGQTSSMKGKKHTEETNEKNRQAHIGNKNRLGQCKFSLKDKENICELRTNGSSYKEIICLYPADRYTIRKIIKGVL